MKSDYEEVYTELYNLWVQHDNLMSYKVDWNFAERICDDYINARMEQKQMTEYEAKQFKQGWYDFTYHMFD